MRYRSHCELRLCCDTVCVCMTITDALCCMGILGPVQCYWCWEWVNNPACPYFEEGWAQGEPAWLGRLQVQRPLCARCHSLWMKRRRPPWKPTAVNRAAMVVGAALGTKIHAWTVQFTVATFLEPWDKP